MKFAQSLNDAVVPEWKAQYLDYKLGKKKLKRLQDGLDSNNNYSPAMSALKSFKLNPRNHDNDTSDFNITGEIDPHSPSGASTSTSHQRNNYDPNFSLPPPAMRDDESIESGHVTIDPSVLQSSPETNPNVLTPLLSAKKSRKNSDIDPVRLSPELNPHPSLLRKQSVLKNVVEGSPLRRAMSLRSALKSGSKSILSAPTTFIRRNSLNRPRTESTSANGFQLQSSFETGKDEFLSWLDEEFYKIDSFYRIKEEDCYHRFLVLQDQLYQLREQKINLKKSRLREEQHLESGISNLNDFAFLAHQTKEKMAYINKFELPSLPSFAFLRKHDHEKSSAKNKSQLNKEQIDELYHDANFRENQIRNGLKKAYEISPSNTRILEQSQSDSSDQDGVTDSQQKPINPKIANPQMLPNNAKAGKRDYEQRSKVPYLTAKRQLKAALLEYYRSLELLKSYRMLNRTAFRKMIKKFDKSTDSKYLPIYMEKVNNSYFSTSDVLDSLFTKIEDLYSIYFEHGNKKISVERLRSKEKPETFYTSFFISGYLLGFGLPLLVLAIYTALDKIMHNKLPEGQFMLQIWGGFLLATLLALAFGINCFVWDKFKINYKFIFEFNVKSALNFKQFFLLPSISFFLISLVGWFSFNNFWPEKFPGRDWPWFYVGFMVIIFCWPGDTFYLSSRRWMQIALWRLLLSGFYPVEFRDFFLGDIFSSLTYSMGNVSFFFCLYGTDWKGALGGTNTSRCGSSRSRLMGFFATLPSIWRFLQCFRRYADTGDWFPHLANMLKYAITATYYMCLSIYRIDRSVSHRVIFIVFAAFNSLYSSAWDIFMDWSLFQSNSKNKYLRNDLVFKRPIYYYVAMVLDVILRFQWVFYAFFGSQIQQSAVTSFCIALAEIIRRFIWIFFRMENEHCTNVNLFRASRETPLPYPVTNIKRTHPKRQESFDVTQSPVTFRHGDEESGIGLSQYQATGGVPTSAGVSTISRRKSFIPSSQVFETVSKALTNAHIKDFQRRKVQHIDEEKDSSDEDEDDDIHSLHSIKETEGDGSDEVGAHLD